MSQQLISVIIPIYNESLQIPILVKEIEVFESTNTDAFTSFQFIFIDDGSIDDSFDLLRTSISGITNAKLVKLTNNFGSHAAIRAGISCADGDYTVLIPADLQIELEVIVTLKNMIREGNDLIWVVREEPEIGYIEKFFSNFYSLLMKKYVNVNFPKEGIESVFFNKKVARQLNLNIENNSSLALQILTFGFKQEFVRIKKKARKVGSSKWTIGKKIKLLIDSFVSFSFAPIRFVSIIGFLIFLIGVSWSVYIIVRKLLFNDLESGWPTIISILLLGFGITNMSLGIIAEYLWRTLDVSRNRPVFIIDEIIELNP